MDVNRIHENLWQGSYPPTELGEQYAEKFDMIVFAAEEYHPPIRDFSPVKCLFLALRERLDDRERALIAKTVVKVSNELKKRSRVLVTCRQGANRSGVIVAGVLVDHYGMTPKAAIALVREKRRVPMGDTHGYWGGYEADPWGYAGRPKVPISIPDYEQYLLSARFERDRLHELGIS